MKKRYLILILLMTLFFNFINLASAKTGAKTDFLPKFEGTWVNEDYINQLKQLRSPIKAVRNIEGYPVFYIRKDDNKYVFNAIAEFHQGIGWVINSVVKLPGDKMYRFSNNQKAQTFDILVMNENKSKINKITLILGKNKTEFVRINNPIDEYVNRIVLAGEYRDNNGKVYKFNNNSFAQWSDQSFKYRLNLDPVFVKFDYFVGKEIYAFEFSGEDLYLYKAKSHETDDGLNRESKPCLVLKPSKSKLTTVQGNLLTPDYAKYYHQFPGGKELSAKEQQTEISKANLLSEEGFAYYKDKKDTLAISKYEEALKYYATAEIYYRYGNSLSNIPRLEDAVKAYQIAIELNYDKPYLIYYNIACVYSRMNKSQEAFTNLELAMNNGYKNFDHIQKDEDLVWLRSQPEWKNWLAEHQK